MMDWSFGDARAAEIEEDNRRLKSMSANQAPNIETAVRAAEKESAAAPVGAV
jgi:hypothetical protein